MLPVCQKLAAGEQGRGQWELSDIFRDYGESYRRAHRLPTSHLKVMRTISVCRTQELGGHLEKCTACGFEHPTYNSCLPVRAARRQAVTAPPQADQSLAKAKWLKKQTAELLPTGYFHLVFTLPHELNWLILSRKKLLLSLLFKAVSETLLEFGETHLRGTLGIIAVLHTWDQTLKDHFHLHCLIPAGALSLDHRHWIATRKNFFFPVKALSLLFRGKFLDLLEEASDQGKLKLPGEMVLLANEKPWKEKLRALRKKKWVVYAKKPFGSPHTVLDYLGRYLSACNAQAGTHRVALSNDRILKVQNGEVTFSFSPRLIRLRRNRDRRDRDRKKTLTLEAQEFIRRFLLHVLPEGFMPA